MRNSTIFLLAGALTAGMLVSAAPAVPITDGLVFQLDATDPLDNGGTTLPGNGTALGTWHNLGSFGDPADATASGSAQPTWYDSGGPNNSPRVNFDGSNDVMTAGTASDWKFLHYDDPGNAFDGSTVFAVWRTTDSNPDGAYGLISTGEASTRQIGYDLWYDDRSSRGFEERARFMITRGVHQNGAISLGNLDGTFPGATWGIQSSVYALGVPGPDGRLLVDGTVVASQETQNTPLTNSDPDHPLTIGDFGSLHSAFYLDGDFAEILIYDRELSELEQDYVGTYLQAKYGLATAYDVPEPSALAVMAGLGLCGAMVWSRRRRRGAG